MNPGIRITGLEQVQQRLQEAPSLLVAKAFHRALDRAAGVIAAEVEARAEALPETGSDTRLFENVITDVQVDVQRRGGTAAVGFSSKIDERTGKPLDFIALQVEFGHAMVTHAGKTVGHVPAKPFMRPAADSVQDRAAQVFGDTLIDQLSVIEEGS